MRHNLFGYLCESLDIRHCRVGHLKFSSINKLKLKKLISYQNKDGKHKGHISVEVKYVKSLINKWHYEF